MHVNLFSTETMALLPEQESMKPTLVEDFEYKMGEDFENLQTFSETTDKKPFPEFEDSNLLYYDSSRDQEEPEMDLARMQPAEPPQEIPNFEEDDEIFLILNEIDDIDELMYGLIPMDAEEIIIMVLQEEQLQEQALLHEPVAPGG